METPIDEQKIFDHVTMLISSSVNDVSRQGCLSLDVIEQVLIIIFSFSWNCSCREYCAVILMTM